MSPCIVEQLKEILGKEVIFTYSMNKKRGTFKGLVIGIYLPHPRQTKEIKVYCEETNKIVYINFKDAKVLRPVKAEAFRDQRTGQVVWYSLGHTPVLDGTLKRDRDYDLDMDMLVPFSSKGRE